MIEMTGLGAGHDEARRILSGSNAEVAETESFIPRGILSYEMKPIKKVPPRREFGDVKRRLKRYSVQVGLEPDDALF